MEFSLNNLRAFGLLGMHFIDGIPLWIYIIGLVVCGTAAYFLGSMNFAIIISKYKFHDDIRRHGSGNGGMTNMMRTYGKSAAAFTLLGDAAKAAVSVLIGTLIIGEAGAYISGFCCILGHAFPAYYKFKGGKGVVTTAVMILCLEPIVFLPLLLLFIGIVAVTKFISLGSIMGVLVYPLFLNRMYSTLHGGERPGAIVTIVSLLIAALVVWLHRSNIKRLWEGKENKFSFGKKEDKKAPKSLISDDEPADTPHDAQDSGKSDSK